MKHETVGAVSSTSVADINFLSNIRTVGSINKIFFPTNAEEIQKVYIYSNENHFEVYPLGGGSNTLIGHLDKIVLISDRCLEKEFQLDATNHNILIVSSKLNINYIALRALEYGLGGLDFIVGLPAHLGGLVFMNAGAYERNISDFIEWIDVVNENGEKRLYKKDIKFEYRYTDIKGFILRVCLKLNRINKETYRQEMKQSLINRRNKYPMSYPNLGCFFKNPENNHAGYLIEQAGLKSYQIGGAMVSSMHANFLVNVGNATFEDFVALIEHVKKVVYDKFGLHLQEEVRIING